ncbi:hypothetical protein E3Q23_03960 [Wallemia mellicola]|nr:hypothetical protein E3Q23_03960 [Wallemia mellicola]
MSTRQRQDKATADKHLTALSHMRLSVNILRTLLKEPYNRKCADCNNKDPRWASWNLGIFVCIRCSGIHRSMGTHISRVKSVDLDMWTTEQIQNMVKWGNRSANLYWQAHLKPGHVVPEQSKYDGRKWARNGPLPSDPKMLETGSGGTSASVNNPITQIQKGAPAPRRAIPSSTSAQSSLIDIAPPAAPVPTNRQKIVPKVQINTKAPTNKPPAPPNTVKQAQQKPQTDNGLLDLDLTATSPTNSVKKANKQDIMSLFAAPPPPNAKPIQQPQQSNLNDAFADLTFSSKPPPTQTQSTDALSALWGPNTAAMDSTGSGSSVDFFGGASVAQPPARASTAPIPPAQQSKNLLDDDDWGPTTGANDGDAFDDWGTTSWEAPPPKATATEKKAPPPAGKIELTNSFSAPPVQPTTSLSFSTTTNNTSSFNSFFDNNTNKINLNDSGYSDTSSKFSSGSAFADIPTSLNDIPAPSKLTSDPFSAFQSTSGGSLDLSSPATQKAKSPMANDFFGDNAWSAPEPAPKPETSKTEENDIWSAPEPEPVPAPAPPVPSVEPTSSLFETLSDLVSPPAASAKPSNDLWESFGSPQETSASSTPAPAATGIGLGDDVWGAPAPAPTSLTTASSPAPAASLADDIWSTPSNPPTAKPPTPPNSAPPPPANPTSLDDVMGNVWAS